MENNTNNNNNNGNGNNRRTTGNRSAAFDPRNPALVQPYKRLVEEGHFTEMTVKFTPWGVTSTAKPSDRLAALGDGMNTTTDYPIGVLAALAEQGNLIPLKGKKGKKTNGATTEQPLPAKSLCKKDFQGTVAELSARAVAVANKAGGSSLIGRVRSEGHFRMTVTTSFANWWQQATAEDRASALVQPKYRLELEDGDVAKLSGLQCPFRGTAEFTVDEGQAHDEESEDENEKRAITTTPTTGKVIGAAANAAQKARKPPANNSK